jgi:hypothetical protein
MTRSILALRLLGLMLIIHCPANASEPALPLESAVPGGLKIIRLDSSGPAMPYVDTDGIARWSFRRLRVGSRSSASRCRAARHAAGDRARRPRQTGIAFSVVDKHYVTQTLKVAPGQVNLSAADLALGQRRKGTHRACIEPPGRSSRPNPASAPAGPRSP